jgi:hypothetical protein
MVTRLPLSYVFLLVLTFRLSLKSRTKARQQRKTKAKERPKAQEKGAPKARSFFEYQAAFDEVLHNIKKVILDKNCLELI